MPSPNRSRETDAALNVLLDDIRGCRICRDSPDRRALPHEPRPVLQVSASARIAICGQAPGTRVHASGRPFTDPSGDRLRNWMGLDCETFYDASRVAIVPMGFCFPGLDAKGGDLPPRPECARIWRERIFTHLPSLKLVLLVGSYAIRWHLGPAGKGKMTETVARWRQYRTAPIWPDGKAPRTMLYPMPHPSWRNNAWLKRNPWFESEVLPSLKSDVASVLDVDGELE